MSIFHTCNVWGKGLREGPLKRFDSIFVPCITYICHEFRWYIISYIKILYSHDEMVNVVVFLYMFLTDLKKILQCIE